MDEQNVSAETYDYLEEMVIDLQKRIKLLTAECKAWREWDLDPNDDIRKLEVARRMVGEL